MVMEYPELREIVATDYATIATQDQEISLTNANDSLFTYPPATGIKTGRRLPRALASRRFDCH